MLKPKHPFVYLISLFGVLLFTTCSKELDEKDFEINTGNTPIVFDIDSINGITPFAQFNRPGGGYILLYQPGQPRYNYEQLNGMIAVSVDKEGKTIQSSYIGGQGRTVIWGVAQDDWGNVYIAGHTNSRDVRKDMWVDSVDDKDAGFLAKVNADAKVLWQVAYSDPNSPNKGKKGEYFWGLDLVDNKPFCVGQNLNYEKDRVLDEISDLYLYDAATPILVGFDENGNITSNQILPKLYSNMYDMSQGVVGNWIDVMKVSETDVVIRNTLFIQQPVPTVPDTATYLVRYNTATKQIVWSKYYLRYSPQGDLLYFGKLGNGNIAFIDNYFNIINVIDQNNGDVVSTITIHNNTYTQSSEFYYNPIPYARGTIDGDLYFTGQVAKGSTIFNRKPFVIKLDANGTFQYEKIFEIPEAGVYWASKNEAGNIRLLGGMNVFKSSTQKMFTIAMDKNGKLISK